MAARTGPEEELSPRGSAAVVLVAAGVAAAIPALQAALGVSLLQAGFLLSMVQLAGLSVGVMLGAWADAIGLRRSLLLGLCVLSAASAAGGFAQGAQAPQWLMLLRALEGVGFLLVVLPAPGLMRQIVPAARLARAMGWWGAYMPLATTLALLLGPLATETLGWSAWWWALAGVTAAMALVAWRRIPVPAAAGASATSRMPLFTRLRLTLSARGPWLLSLTFAAYAGQWLAVLGFLPTVYRQAGFSAAATGLLTACVAAVNIGGNVMAGRLQHRGWTPPRLLFTGFVTMGLAGLLTFADLGQPAWARYVAVLAFSGLGGMVPGTLFALVVRLAPGEHTMSSTVGWMQQGSAFGQFAGPPLVAWIASLAGGWQYTGLATASSALLGLLLTRAIAHQLAHQLAHPPARR